MAIQSYTRKAPHPSGFIGLRVLVVCRESGILQEYFGLAHTDRKKDWEATRKKAEKLEAKWLRLQAQERRAWRNQRLDEARGGDKTKTGIRGIRMRFRPYETQTGTTYAPQLICSAHYEGGGRVRKTLVIGRKRTLEQAWIQALNLICQVHRIRRERRRELLSTPPPTPKQWESLRRSMKRQGHGITKQEIPTPTE